MTSPTKWLSLLLLLASLLPGGAARAVEPKWRPGVGWRANQGRVEITDKSMQEARSDGTLWRWGGAAFGVMPLPAAQTGWVSSVGEAGSSLGIKSDGSLWSWSGTTTPLFAVPAVRLDPGNDWVFAEVSSFGSNYAAIKADGTLWTWGVTGELLGHGDGAPRDTPTQVGSDTDWVQVVAGSASMSALKSDGTLWSWGMGGGLGAGSLDLELAPVQVGSDHRWRQLATNTSRTVVGLKSDGTLWTWGPDGWLGTNPSVTQLVPTQFGADTDWIQVSIGEGHLVALKADHSLWAWGRASDGQLGNGVTGTPPLYMPTPQRVGFDNDWLWASAYAFHNYAGKADGTLWTWGSGLGLVDPNAVNSAIPVLIGDSSNLPPRIVAMSGPKLMQAVDRSLWVPTENYPALAGGGFRDWISFDQYGVGSSGSVGASV
ncbi:MAG: hypothetical protein HY901_32275, partial [Deltaproteobacteria bacterium]|nr:hypothetical protein [Deltaproteobacteria bacterium]